MLNKKQWLILLTILDTVVHDWEWSKEDLAELDDLYAKAIKATNN